MATYLDFEKNIKQIDEDLSAALTKVDTHAVEILEKELQKETNKTYKNLSDYQKLQLARHPDRPYTMDYIRALLTDSYELHGDRAFGDDSAMLCYIGYIGERKVMVIGEQKGRGTKNKLKEILVCLILKGIEKHFVWQNWQKSLIYQFFFGRHPRRISGNRCRRTWTE